MRISSINIEFKVLKIELLSMRISLFNAESLMNNLHYMSFNLIIRYDTPFPHVQEPLYLPSKWKLMAAIKEQMEV